MRKNLIGIKQLMNSLHQYFDKGTHLNITFLIADQQKVHEGVVRPFVNFAKALKQKYEFSFLLINCSSDFAEHMRKGSFEVIVSKNKNEAIQALKNLKPNFIFTDDDLKRIKLAREINKKINAKTISYVQVLYGSHSIVDCFEPNSLTFMEKVRFVTMKYVPFSFFRNRYVKSLKTFDLLIANSKVTATFLHTLYNLGVSGVIYPPIDTDVFQPKGQKTQKEIIIYLGSHLGDTNYALARKIVANVAENGYIANLFGNSRMASQIIAEGSKSVLYHSYLSDIELAQMYSRSKLTVCPQKWEQFGMVPVESISCGTPVLAFNCMGFQETIGQTDGWLANNDDEFLQKLHDALDGEQLPIQDLRNTAINQFSIIASGRALEDLLEKYFSKKT
jgi:glycosyltransferase involved in cell wall biosynthesis